MKLYGLIGYPLGHSFSKKYFTEKFKREGLAEFTYELFPIPSITEFPSILHSNPTLKGLNVTPFGIKELNKERTGFTNSTERIIAIKVSTNVSIKNRSIRLTFLLPKTFLTPTSLDL